MLLYVHKNQVHSECMLLFKCCMLRADGAAGWLMGRLFSLIRLPHEYVHCASLEIIIAIKSSTTGVRARRMMAITAGVLCCSSVKNIDFQV